MKIIFALVVIAVCYVNAEITAEQLEKLNSMFKECKEKTGVTDEDIGLLMQQKAPESKIGNCFAGCMEKQIGVLDADNKVNVARVNELLEYVKEKDADKAEALSKVAETCAAEVSGGDDECDAAAKLMNCYTREIKEAGITFSMTDLYSA